MEPENKEKPVETNPNLAPFPSQTPPNLDYNITNYPREKDKPRKPKNIRLLSIIVSVILFLLVFISAGAIGYFSGNINRYYLVLDQIKNFIRPKSLINNPSPTPSSNPNSSGSADISETATWQTFSDRNLSFKYPNSWKGVGFSANSGYIETQSKNRFYLEVIESSTPSLTEWLQSYDIANQNTFQVQSSKTDTVNNHTVIQRNEYDIESDTTYLASYFQSEQVSVIRVKIMPTPGNILGSDEQTYNQILSTLAFTNSSTNDSSANCTYNGKTYKNGEGFTDKCNSCSCENGQVACTLIACPE